MQRILMLVGISTVMHFALVSGILDPEVRRLSGGDPRVPDCTGVTEEVMCKQRPENTNTCDEHYDGYIKTSANKVVHAPSTSWVCTSPGCKKEAKSVAQTGCREN